MAEPKSMERGGAAIDQHVEEMRSKAHSQEDVESQLLAEATDAFFDQVEAGAEPDIGQFAAQYPGIELLLRKVLPALRVVREAKVLSSVGPYHAGTSPAPGLHLGDYLLLRELGRGGMGVVFEARQLSLDRRVAVKILPFAATIDSKRIQRFRNESQAVASLDHPNIVEVHSVGCEGGVHFFTMKLVDGQTLADVISELPVTPGDDHGADTTRSASFSLTTTRPEECDDAGLEPSSFIEKPMSKGLRSSLTALDRSRYRNMATLIRDVALALDHAHTQGIIHRDIKPSNIMIDVEGKPWVTDFGLAQVASGESLTLTGDLVGTVRYMAPEQLKAMPIDHRIDIYALGACLYELMTLQPLVQGEDRESIIRCLRDGKQIRPTRFNPRIPRDLETIVLKSVEREPQRRYATAAEFADDLDAWLDGKPISARPVGNLERSWRWCKRNPWVTISLCLLVFSTLLTSWFAMQTLQANELISHEKRRSDDALRLIVNEVFSFADPYAEPNREILFREVLDSATERIKATTEYETAVRLNLLIELARVYFNLEEYSKSEELFAYCLSVATAEFGERDPVALKAMDQLGMVLMHSGKLERANELLTKAWRIQEVELGPEHADTIHSRAKLGDLAHDMGDYEKAVSIGHEVLTIRDRNWGPASRYSLVTHNGLGLLYLDLDDPEQAIKHLRFAFEQAREKNYEAEILYYMHNLGLALIENGDLSEAERLIRTCIHERELILDATSPSLLLTKSRLAMLLRLQGKSSEALELMTDLWNSVGPSMTELGLARIEYELALCLIASGQDAEGYGHLEHAKLKLDQRLTPRNRHSRQAARLLEQRD